MFGAHIGYNSFAGLDISRTKAIADGVFAFALTLLVLGLSVPVSTGILEEHQLWLQLTSIGPSLLVYFMSFITLGNFWTGHSVQYTYITKSDRNLTWLSLFFLMFVSLVPFSTALLSDYITFRTAITVYWANILLLGLLLLLHWHYAWKNDFVPRDPVHEEVDKAIRNRLIIAELLYAGAALLSIYSTYLSIVLLIAIQLNYAVAPAFFRQRFF
jgi:uncharacterized membrane protein